MSRAHLGLHAASSLAAAGLAAALTLLAAPGAAAAAQAPAAPVTPAAPASPTSPATPATPGTPADTARPAAVAPAGRLAPCHLPGIREAVRCGSYEVWEDREARRGRRISLNIVVLPALGPHRAPDAIVNLAGGPGEAVTDSAGSIADDRRQRRDRDILLVDQRGTGRSNPLQCDFYGQDSQIKDADPARLAGELFPPAAVRACRDRLEKVADLRLYTTAIAMDDLDEVRAWLGYPRVDLLGGSYGTRAAQVYMRRHPRSVRCAVLDGVVPVDETIPLHHAYAGKRSVDLVIAECAAEAPCHAAFPNLAAELQEVMARVDRGVKVGIPDAKTGGTIEVTPDRGLIAEGIRFMSYDSEVRKLPLAIHRAYQGDLAQLVSLAVERRVLIDRILAMGMDFSVTCAEDLPYIDDAAAARATAGTLLGDYRIREQKRVCADWPRGAIPADAHELVRSEAPVLLLSGERDPVTPPEFGDRVASRLPNSLHVVFPHSGHGAGGPCATNIVDRFVETATVKGLDVACAAKTPPARFLIKAPVEVHLAARLLDAYAGTYTFPGFVVALSRVGDHLVAKTPGDADMELFADAEDHFFAKGSDVEMKIVRDRAGAATGAVLKSGDDELRGKRNR